MVLIKLAQGRRVGVLLLVSKQPHCGLYVLDRVPKPTKVPKQGVNRMDLVFRAVRFSKADENGAAGGTDGHY